MIQRIKSWVVASAFVAVTAGAALTVALPQSASAIPRASVEECSVRILSFPTWFRGLVELDAQSECAIKSPDSLNTAAAGEPNNGLANFIWRIALNVIEIGLQIVGYIAVGFIIYGGFQFLTSAGDPAAATKARLSILHAVIGLAISIGSVAIVNLVFGILG